MNSEAEEERDNASATYRQPTILYQSGNRKWAQKGPAMAGIQRPLTPRQRQVLHLILDGATNQLIAKQLKISLKTVQLHRFNLMRRLQVRNVAQLMRQALLLKYAPDDYLAHAAGSSRHRI